MKQKRGATAASPINGASANVMLYGAISKVVNNAIDLTVLTLGHSVRSILCRAGFLGIVGSFFQQNGLQPNPLSQFEVVSMPVARNHWVANQDCLIPPK
ncbi:hypothetical protein [Alteromonas sp. C1M14]|uniref:hypothetical protein n=1 Tax=Alteromonas sp. C1M14 TaxID=2841567 RepID=UPI001C08EA07|nr:hypothetical protein [Alteromonas sp. C1M14]MBU2979324.1 hypothetical protein [Alteromonas sp. C1M14]